MLITNLPVNIYKLQYKCFVSNDVTGISLLSSIGICPTTYLLDNLPDW